MIRDAGECEICGAPIREVEGCCGEIAEVLYGCNCRELSGDNKE